MKKILFIAGIVLSLPLKANELKCEESYEYFEIKAIEEMKNYEKGDFDAVREFSNSWYYAMNFKGPIPKKEKYYFGEWVNNKEFNRSIKNYLKAFDLSKSHFIDISYGKPKINYISDLGEICVVPVKTQNVVLGRNINTVSDMIFIRNLQTDTWKGFTYLGIEKKADMDLLFPGLISKVRLSQALYNNKDLVDSNIEIAIEFLKERRTNLPKEELLDVAKKHLEPKNEMLKINGYK